MILSIGILLHTVCFSQSCLPEGIMFTAQNQIDNFPINYPNCTRIEGDILIGEAGGIYNLDSLIVLTSIGGSLWMHFNTELVSISGLQNITSIGGSLIIEENGLLPSLSGLENLDSIGGDLNLAFNGALTSLNPLSGVSYIGGNISLASNNGLVNLIGLDNISSIEGSLEIIYNASLTTLEGLEDITSIGGYLGIWSNSSLVSLEALSNVTTIGSDLRLGTGWGGNHSLTDLMGFRNLLSIGGRLWIIDNISLTNLTGLDSLISVGGDLWITDNNSLTSLAGIDNIAAGSIEDLEIINNTILSTCEVLSICNYLSAPNGTIEIHDNATGCNSQQEVENACFIGVSEIECLVSNISIFPNPASSQITIKFSNEIPLQKSSTLSLYDIGNRQIIEQTITNSETIIDITDLKVGIYFIKLVNQNSVLVRKLLKK